MNFIVLALKYLPLVVQAVIAIEAVYAGQTAAGKTKKQLVLDAVAGVGGAFGKHDDETIKVIGTLVDSVVKTFNTLGWGK